jgi:hypothetical protein
MNSLKAAFLFLFIFLINFIPLKAFAGLLDTLQPGHWYEVPNSKIRPNLPSPLPPGYTGPSSITVAWNGGFFDAVRNRYVVMGGGHGDYAGNEMYGFNLDTLQWSRLWGPTPNSQIPPIGSAGVEIYADGNPSSRHTYSCVQYLPKLDKYFIHGGSVWGGSGGMGKITWFFDPALSTWTQRADISSGCYGGATVPFTAYDPNTGNVYAHKYNSLCEYNPLTNTWRKRGGDSKGAAPNATAVFDSKRKQFCLIGGAKGAGQTMCYDMTSTATSIPLQTIATKGDKTAENASYPGVDYDPISEKIVAWLGGMDVYALDLTTKVWTKVPPASNNTVTPTAPTHTGSHSRWRYIPSKNVFIIVNSIDQNVYAYKLSSGTGTPPPVTATPNMPSNLQIVGLAPPPPVDTAPPSVPAGLTAQVVSFSQINLSWTASTDNVGVTGYTVFRNNAQIATIAATSYQNTGLLPSTTYSFTVAASDAAGNQTAQSNPTTATTLSGTSPTQPPSGQINLPLRTWVKVQPTSNYGNPYYLMKHTVAAYNPDDGLIYLFNGDHNGARPADPNVINNGADSGRNEIYTYDLALSKLTLIQRYCQPGLIASRLDQVGIAWDTKRHVFWMFPGYQWAGGNPRTNDPNCNNNPAVNQQVFDQVMKYAPGSGDYLTGPGNWAVVSDAAAGRATVGGGVGQQGSWTVYDPVTDRFILFTTEGNGGPRVQLYNPNANTWAQVGSPTIGFNDDYKNVLTTIDIVGRRVFGVSQQTGLWVYNIDAKTFQVLTTPANLPDPTSFGNTGPEGWHSPLVWDSVNNVFLWVWFQDVDCTNPVNATACATLTNNQVVAHIHAYHPDTNTWEANLASGVLSNGTRVKGRTAIFDSKQNALLLFGNVWNVPQADGFFLFRYGHGK